MKMYKTVILFYVGVGDWGAEEDVRTQCQETGENCIKRSFMICTPHHIIKVMKSRRMNWVGHVARTRDKTGTYRVFVGRPEGKRPHGTSTRRWEDNFKLGNQEVGLGGGVDWIGLA